MFALHQKKIVWWRFLLQIALSYSTNANRLSVAVVKLYAVACGMYSYMDWIGF